MSHLIKLVAVISLLYLIPAQASFDIATGSECIIFADDGSKEDGKKNGDADTEEEEEEPDCD
ncbi:MAG: hypothetical protein ABUK13_06175 [Gammaproteobacteria bacterium]